MAGFTEKKRKRHEDASSQQRKADKPSAQSSPGPRSLQVTKVVHPKTSPPVLALFPGLEPPSVNFNAYDKTYGPKKRRKDGGEMVLHSTSHPLMEYTGREVSTPGLQHFIGIFDPKSGKMEVIEAKKMVVRGAVRSQQVGEAKDKQTNFQLRTELGEVFGTRKSKKAIKAVTENSIQATRSGKMEQGDSAIMHSLEKTTKGMATREELQAVVDQARPVPRGNYDAEEVQDVYIPEEIIGAEVLNAIPVMEWQDKVKNQEAVEVPSRFVANRINRVAHNEDAVKRLKVMRYLVWVLVFFSTTKPGKERGTKSIGKRDELREVMAPAPDIVIENIRRKFSDSGVMRKTHVDLLMTHICAFAMIIDNFEVNTADLREDLKLGEQRQMNQYFMEIGARIKQTKREGLTDYVAQLTLPLQFPQMRVVRGRK
ncbi:RNA polymerase [Podospora conica]|nr:RNA polymerase [Schizothecium conicum]